MEYEAPMSPTAVGAARIASAVLQGTGAALAAAALTADPAAGSSPWTQPWFSATGAAGAALVLAGCAARAAADLIVAAAADPWYGVGTGVVVFGVALAVGAAALVALGLVVSGGAGEWWTRAEGAGAGAGLLAAAAVALPIAARGAPAVDAWARAALPLAACAAAAVAAAFKAREKGARPWRVWTLAGCALCAAGAAGAEAFIAATTVRAIAEQRGALSVDMADLII